jgi:hypothetical protein
MAGHFYGRCLSPTEVNLLADLSCWCLTSNAGLVKGLFGS